MDRTDLDFNTPETEGVLPEYFQRDYPKLIEFMNLYSKFMEEAGYNQRIRDIRDTNDIGSVSPEYYEDILGEIGLGVTSRNRRDLIKNFPEFYRNKGTLNGIRAFFREFYDEEVEIEYPKNNLFIVGDLDSKIGTASGKVIQNGRLYQILSILIKSSSSVNVWGELYKRLAHPAGFYFGSSADVFSFYSLNMGNQPCSVVNEDSHLERPTAQNEALVKPRARREKLSATYIDHDGSTYTIDTDRPIKDITLNMDDIDEQYDSIKDLDALDRPLWSNNRVVFSSDYERFSSRRYK